MPENSSDWKPTARLRWRKAAADEDVPVCFGLAAPNGNVRKFTLQIWYAADVPSYMRTQSDGEWRDVVVEETYISTGEPDG